MPSLAEDVRREIIETLTLRDLKTGKGSEVQQGAYREYEWRKCKKDPAYFIETYGRLKAKSGLIVPFELYPVQRKLIKDWRRKNSTIAVKARQLGVTTLASVYALWEVLFHDAAEWNIVAATEVKAAEVIERMQPTLSSLPPWMRERAQRRQGDTAAGDKRRDRGEASFKFKAGFAKMAVMPSTERNIGGAVGNIIWDEFTRHDDQEKKYKLAWPTFEGGGMMAIIANGNGDDFFRALYIKAQNGESKMKAYFFDWMEVPTRLDGAYIVNDDGTQTPVRYEGGEGYANKDAAMKAHLQGKLVCPWYDDAKREYMVLNPEADDFDFKAQYPSTEEEAFFITGNSRFPAFWANELSRVCKLERMGIAHANKSKKDFHWPETGFIEKRKSGYHFQHFVSGKLQVWEMPIDGAKYTIGVDCAAGKQAGDYTVFEVIKVVNGGLADQVAEYRAKEEPSEVARKLADLARFYNNAFVVIERNGPGYAVIERIKDDYSNLYRHVNTVRRFGDEQEDTIGYPLMGSGTKDVVVSLLAEWVDCGTSAEPKQPMLTVRSQNFIQEMPTFLIDPKTGKVGAPKGQHDDTIMAMAYAIVGLQNVNTKRGAKRKSFGMSWQF